MVVKPIEQDLEEDVEDCNFGTKEDSKVVKLAKGVPKEYKQIYLDLFNEYMDVSVWSYDDLKTFDPSVIQHKIPLKAGVKPYKQKLRYVNPFLLPSIEKEVKKLLHANINLPLRYSYWVAN